jgi:TolC family type I secretion outer membrane protein
MRQFKRNGLRLQGVLLAAVILFLFPMTAKPADTPGVAAQAPVSAPPGAQAGKPLTLDEVVRIALENHSSVKSAQFQIKAQDAAVHQQMAAYYPTVNFINSYRTSNTVSGTSATASRAFDSVSSAANVSMTLYNFGKREGLVQSARDTLDATQYAYNTTANNIVLAVKQSYYGVLQANALLRVNEDTVKSREVTLRQAQGFYDVGTKPKSDLTQAEANLYLAQANLIAARNGVDVAWANLINAMGVDDYPKQPLPEDLSVAPFPMSLDEAKKSAFSSRPELLQFDAQLKAQDELIAVARRNHLPDFLFNSSYGRQGNDAASNLFPLQPSWQVQLSVNIPIFNGFQTTYQVQQALYNYYSIKEQERVERQQVALQVQQNYLNLGAAQEIVKANEAAVRAAKENLELHQGRYQVGYAPLVEVTDAQTTYTTAQTNYVNALVSYKLALAQLVNAIGRQ